MSTEDKLNYFKDYDKKEKCKYNIDWGKFYDWLWMSRLNISLDADKRNKTDKENNI